MDLSAFTDVFQLTPTLRRDPYEAILPSNPANQQTGKIVLIAGAGSGIGAAAARVWSKAGAEGIVLVGRRADRLDATAKELKDSRTLCVSADMADEASIASLFPKIKAEMGRAPDVVITAAALPPLGAKTFDSNVGDWFRAFEVNVRGLYSLMSHWIKSQETPQNPVGTLIYVSGGLEAITFPGTSELAISKLAARRLLEFAQTEHPTLRLFTTIPGLTATEMTDENMRSYANDHVELTGMISLWLVQSRADFMKGSLMSVNWDVEELEQRKEEIEAKGLLKLSWMPLLPVSGGKGFFGS